MHTLLTICRSLIAPCITYGLVAWGQASKSSIDKLLKLQKRVLRLIYSSDHNEHVIPLFPDADILLLTFSYYESIVNSMLKSDMEFRQKVSRPYLSMSSVFITSKLNRVMQSNDLYMKPSRRSIQANSFFQNRRKNMEQKISLSLRSLSKNTFKQNLINILNAENSYSGVPELIQNMKSFLLRSLQICYLIVIAVLSQLV